MHRPQGPAEPPLDRNTIHRIGTAVATRARASALQVIVAAAIVIRLGACAASARADETQAALWDAQQSELCAAALREAEQRYHLPPALLSSIAKVESGRPITSLADIRPWPWTIDADGTGLFLDSKAAAVAWVRQQASRHRFIDVGCMQIDLYYHPHAFASMEEAFDPAANADYAARLLTSLYRGEAGGSWDVAVGLYHSHTSLLAALYRDRVALIGADVLHGTLRGRRFMCRRSGRGRCACRLATAVPRRSTCIASRRGVRVIPSPRARSLRSLGRT